MVAINPKKNLHFGENPPEINLNSNLKRWFSRNIGLWKSNRTYFFDEAQKTYNLSMNINIQALESKSEWESHYKFTWYPEKKYNFFDENPQYKERGEMHAFLKGHQLKREKFYLSNDEGISNIKQVDEHEMIFESSYKDWYILEHTRLVDSDNYRFRVIYSWNKNKLKIVSLKVFKSFVEDDEEKDVIEILENLESRQEVKDIKIKSGNKINKTKDDVNAYPWDELEKSLRKHGMLTPLDVDITEIANPPMYIGISSFREYDLNPGVLTLVKPFSAEFLSESYLRSTFVKDLFSFVVEVKFDI